MNNNTYFQLLIQLSDEFVDYVIDSTTKLAKHRGAKTVEAKDVIFHLEKDWEILLPDSYLTTIPK